MTNLATLDAYGALIEPAALKLERLLPGPIERVWDYLTDSEKRARWFAGGPIELRPGGQVTLNFRHKNLVPDETPPEEYQKHHDPGSSMTGIVTRCEPPRLLAFTFGGDGESEARFELTPQGKDVLLVLTHRAWGGDLPFMADFGAGWHAHVAHLIALLEGAPRPPFWPLHTQLKAYYEKLRVAAQSA